MRRVRRPGDGWPPSGDAVDDRDPTCADVTVNGGRAPVAELRPIARRVAVQASEPDSEPKLVRVFDVSGRTVSGSLAIESAPAVESKLRPCGLDSGVEAVADPAARDWVRERRRAVDRDWSANLLPGVPARPPDVRWTGSSMEEPADWPPRVDPGVRSEAGAGGTRSEVGADSVRSEVGNGVPPGVDASGRADALSERPVEPVDSRAGVRVP